MELDMISAHRTITDYDKEERLKKESTILEKANRLAENPEGSNNLMGEIMLWQVTEIIAQGRLLRVIAKDQTEFQTITACKELHRNKNWIVKLFGESYTIPASIAVTFLYFIVRGILIKQGLL